MGFDLVLAGGSVVDGTGAPARVADVAVRDGTITAVGDVGAAEARERIDCQGCTVTPGFIDIHSHTDWLLPGADHGAVVEPFVRQGMTSLVGGNCGFTPAPITEKNRNVAKDTSRLIVDDAIELRWDSMGGFLDALEAGGVALNVAQLVGHGSLRAAVRGPFDPAPPGAEDWTELERLTRDALASGCIGISTGLGYPPGMFAGEDELARFAAWAAREGKLFTSHLKAYSWVSGVFSLDPHETPHNVAAIDEILRVAEPSGVRLQISHLIFVGRKTWPTHEQALRRIDEARARGLDVGFDAFPYTAGNTTASVLFPAAIQDRLEAVLGDETQRDNLERFAGLAFSGLGFGLADIQILRSHIPGWEAYDGLRVDAAAERAGREPFEFYCEMVVKSGRAARVLLHTYSGDGDHEEPLRAVLRHPLCTIETDTFVTQHGHQNPASYGTFPRVLSTYVEQGLFGFEEAVRRMSGAAAERLGWKDRGWIRPGCAADLVVLDRDTLADTATFEDPRRFPSGVEHVWINGFHVVDGERYRPDLRAGRVLRA